MKAKKILIILPMIIVMLITSSCKEQEELEDIGIVIATALDWEDEEVLLTVEVIIPINRAEQSGESSSIILQERGDSVMEAIRNITLNFDRKLFWSHNTIIVFGESFAKKGIGSYLDFFTRDNEPRENAYLAVAKGSMAYEVIGINSSLEGSSGEYFKALLENSPLSLKSRSLTVNEFFKYYFSEGTPLLSILEKVEYISIEPGTGEISSRNIIDVRGGAPFYKDKLVGYYSADEMIGFNFLVNEVVEGIIVFETPSEALDYSNLMSQPGNTTTYEIVNSTTKKDFQIIDGKINLNIGLDVKGLIAEDNMGLDITILEVKDMVELACAEKIKEVITLTMEKAQELGIDSFSIGHAFNLQYPNEYKKIEDNWNQEFSRLNYSIDVNVDIIKTGLTNTPTNIMKGGDN